MRLFRPFALAALLAGGILGCRPDEREWLAAYRSAACDSVRLHEQMQQAAAQASTGPRERKQALQAELERAQEPYRARIDALRARIRAAQDEYARRYAEAKAAYEKRYGHDVEHIHLLEDQEKALQARRDRLVRALEVEMARLEARIADAPEVRSIREQIVEADREILATMERVAAGPQAQLMQAGHRLDSLRARKTEYTWHLKGDDRSAFDELLAAADESPCQEP